MKETVRRCHVAVYVVMGVVVVASGSSPSAYIRGLIRRIDRGDPNARLYYHSEHLGQSLDQASDVCRRSNMLRKLTCIAGSSYLSAALKEIIP